MYHELHRPVQNMRTFFVLYDLDPVAVFRRLDYIFYRYAHAALRFITYCCGIMSMANTK